jgi:hypothetical protein
MDQTDKKSKNSFRLQNRKVHITYQSHIDPTVWLSWAKSIKKLQIDSYSIVHESADENHPYPHTHILLDAGKGKKFSTTSCRFFDWTTDTKELIHPNIKPVTTIEHWNNTVIYHYKENKPVTNIIKPTSTKEEIEKIWGCKTASEALLTTCSSLKSVGGVIAAFNCKPSDYGIEPKVDWRPWQKELMDELNQEPDDRKILWYYDPKGSSGKSFIAKHLGMYQHAFVSTKANTYHVATQLDEFIKSNGDTILIVVFNFTRQQEYHKIYQALEELKDGMVTTEKYKGKTLFFKSPHVVCLANYIPEVKHFTIDRWDIRALQDDRVVKRFVSGKMVFEDPNIDPYINYTLKDLENQYNELENNVDSFEFQRDQFMLKLREEKERRFPKKQEPERPLNINGAPENQASLGNSAHSAHPQSGFELKMDNPFISNNLIKQTNTISKLPPLANHKPSAPSQINGTWINNRFVSDNMSLNQDNIEINCGGKIIKGDWKQGTFYPK